MKKILTFVSLAWQSLKYWCDPAMEGNPYAKNYEVKKNLRPNRPSLPRRFVFGRF